MCVRPVLPDVTLVAQILNWKQNQWHFKAKPLIPSFHCFGVLSSGWVGVFYQQVFTQQVPAPGDLPSESVLWDLLQNRGHFSLCLSRYWFFVSLCVCLHACVFVLRERVRVCVCVFAWVHESMCVHAN